MRLLTTLLLAAATLAQQPSAGKPKLEYVVMLSRHGVRSPTAANDALSQYAAEPWPNWGVGPGELTEHGRKLLRILGGWYRGWFAQDGLLPESGCGPAAVVHVRADVGQRTMESARALADGMFPGCAIQTHFAPSDPDPLFHPVTAGLVRGDATLASAAISGRVGGHPEAIAPTLQHAFGVLNEILFGCPIGTPCPPARQPGKQALLSLPASVTGTDDGLADIRGPIRTGSTMAENLQLEYADGKTGKDLGWGRLDEAQLHEVMAIHTAYADLTRRTTYLATVQGSNLLNAILRSMEQAVSGKAVAGAIGKPGDRLLLLDGHDTNISHVAGLLNTSWLTPGYQRDDAPPGGSLVFRLWQAEGHYSVESLYIAQTLNQMHDTVSLTRDSGPAISLISIPGCRPQAGPNQCDWESFRQVAARAIDPKYVRVR
jgi:4-phytase / acid phosphatase